MNGFDIFETPVLSKEHTDMLAKELSKNSPMRDINQHYSEELQVLNEMKAKMEQQAAEDDKKHKQSMCWARWAVILASLTLLTTIISIFIKG